MGNKIVLHYRNTNKNNKNNKIQKLRLKKKIPNKLFLFIYLTKTITYFISLLIHLNNTKNIAFWLYV